MLVRNWYMCYALCMAKKSITDSTSENTLKNINGEKVASYTVDSSIGSHNTDTLRQIYTSMNVKLTMPSAKYSDGSNDNSGDCGGIMLGSGNTQPSFEDYQIENKIENLTVQSSSHITDRFIRNIVLSVTNNNGEPITITEYGHVEDIRAGVQYQAPTNMILLSRCLLDIPVTIQPGETGVVIINETISALSQ